MGSDYSTKIIGGILMDELDAILILDNIRPECEAQREALQMAVRSLEKKKILEGQIIKLLREFMKE